MSAHETIVWIGLVTCLGCVPHTDPPVVTASPAPAAAAAPAASSAPSQPPVAQSPPVAANPAAPAAPNIGGVAGTFQADTASQPAVSAPAASTTAEKPGERVAAKAGVGLKGQSLKNETGFLVEPAKAYFRTEQRIIFEDVIPKNMSLFEATEGRKPKSHEEFMSKIIEANQTKLPTLPPGDKYVYDPERGELMVEKRPR